MELADSCEDIVIVLNVSQYCYTYSSDIMQVMIKTRVLVISSESAVTQLLIRVRQFSLGCWSHYTLNQKLRFQQYQE
jgi:hypothetical protein